MLYFCFFEVSIAQLRFKFVKNSVYHLRECKLLVYDSPFSEAESSSNMLHVSVFP
jgi:hypothetical protein